jgi:3,4-dihydroxy 2-butanone 4-phosphate synthase / GTP cyclohydrolase II
MADLEVFAEEHGLRIITVADLIAYRLQRERIVQCKQVGKIRPALLGAGEDFEAACTTPTSRTPSTWSWSAATSKAPSQAGEVLVRVQTLDPIGDPSACAPICAQLHARPRREGCGVLLYVYNKAASASSAPSSAGLGQGERGQGPMAA